jgi:hypothetical protein
MSRTKKPKVQIKREKASLGWAYKIYIGGMYMGTALTSGHLCRNALLFTPVFTPARFVRFAARRKK